MLTARQLELLTYIDRRIREDGIGPTFGEMAKATGYASKSAVYAILARLEERGFVRRLVGRARGVEVLKMPGHPIASTTTIREIALSKCPQDYGFVEREAFVQGFLAAGYFFVFDAPGNLERATC